MESHTAIGLNFWQNCFQLLLTLKTFSLFIKPNPEYVDCKLFNACERKIRFYLFSEVLYFSLPSLGWNAFQVMMPNKQFAIKQQKKITYLCWLYFLPQIWYPLPINSLLMSILKPSQNQTVQLLLGHKSYLLCFTSPERNPWELQFKWFLL